MIPYYGDFPEDYTKIKIPFNTFDSNDPTASVTVTTLVDADIKVHKDGGATPIATDGATIVINLNSVTGNHIITIDTSVHADYAAASEYSVRIEGATVDAGNINGWVGSFSIERAGGVLALIKAGTIKVDLETIKTQAITAAAGVTINPSVGAATIQPTNTQFEARTRPTADYFNQTTDEVTTDAASRTASQATGFATETKQDIMQGNVTDILDDTNELQTDDVPGLIGALNDFDPDAAIPGTPTADSINEYIQIMKYVMLNKTTVTKATGTSVILKDNDSTIYATVVGAYVEDPTTVVRLRLE